MDDTTPYPQPRYAPDPVTEYTIRNLAAALDRVRRRHSHVMGDITQPIVRRALAMASDTLPRRPTIDESWSRDD